MTDALGFLLWPFLATVAITLIHAYLGFHVVERGVIFVDLALAQVAALGATFGFLFGHGMHDPSSVLFSIGAVALAAALLAGLRMDEGRVPQEAFIGIVYAVSAALAVLIVDRTPEGAEHIKFMLVGNLLAATPTEVLRAAALYAGMGLLHYLWRKPFFAISRGRLEGMSPGKVRLWDFLFYLTFGLVVTQAVALAGVLLVFSYLIVPSVIAILLTRGDRARLTMGWAVGLFVSAAGIAASFVLDLPTGATIAAAFGAVLALTLLTRVAVRASARSRQ